MGIQYAPQDAYRFVIYLSTVLAENNEIFDHIMHYIYIHICINITIYPQTYPSMHVCLDMHRMYALRY